MPLQLMRRMDRLFGDAWSDLLRDFGPAAPFPAVNLWEDGENLYAEAEVPGLSMNDIEVLVVDNELTIKGRRQAAEERKDVVYHRQERGALEFSRVLSLPCPVNPDRVQATLKDGVLRITMPKVEQARARRIEVRPA